MSTMNKLTGASLKVLLSCLPEGFMVDSKWLASKGYSRQSVHHYAASGWLERVAHGLYRRPLPLGFVPGGPDWLAPLASAQWMGYAVHVGGSTALNLSGYVHFLPLGDREVAYLYSDAPPSWFKRLELVSQVRFRNLKLFGGDKLGVECIGPQSPVGGGALAALRYPVAVSSAERAVLETLDELPTNEGFGSVDGVFESLTDLRPQLMANLLRLCRSVKVKRLFFVFADRHQHAWREHLHAADFDLGSGDRQLVTGGRLHPTYRITVPAEFVPAAEGSNNGP